MGSSPNWISQYGYVATPGQWAAAFASKQDDIGLTLLTIEELQAGIPQLINGNFTLNANATSTLVPVPFMLSTSVFKWWPATADAALMLPFLYLPLAGRVGGSVTLQHPSNPAVDLTFLFEVTV